MPVKVSTIRQTHSPKGCLHYPGVLFDIGKDFLTWLRRHQVMYQGFGSTLAVVHWKGLMNTDLLQGISLQTVESRLRVQSYALKADRLAWTVQAMQRFWLNETAPHFLVDPIAWLFDQFSYPFLCHAAISLPDATQKLAGRMHDSHITPCSIAYHT